jgi:hypothetical protein
MRLTSPDGLPSCRADAAAANVTIARKENAPIPRQATTKVITMPDRYWATAFGGSRGRSRGERDAGVGVAAVAERVLVEVLLSVGINPRIWSYSVPVTSARDDYSLSELEALFLQGDPAKVARVAAQLYRTVKLQEARLQALEEGPDIAYVLRSLGVKGEDQ